MNKSFIVTLTNDETYEHVPTILIVNAPNKEFIVNNIEIVHSTIGSFFGLSLSDITNIMNRHVIITLIIFVSVIIFLSSFFEKI